MLKLDVILKQKGLQHQAGLPAAGWQCRELSFANRKRVSFGTEALKPSESCKAACPKGTALTAVCSCRAAFSLVAEAKCVH